MIKHSNNITKLSALVILVSAVALSVCISYPSHMNFLGGGNATYLFSGLCISSAIDCLIFYRHQKTHKYQQSSRLAQLHQSSVVQASVKLNPQHEGNLFFEAGVRAPIDQKEELFLKAASFNHIEACYALGNFYQHRNDMEKCIQYTKKAADLGHGEAMYAMACHYEDGNGVIKSYSEAVTYLQRGVALNHGRSHCLLGLYYELGFGVPKNNRQSLMHLERASLLGVPEAMVPAGKYYEDGTDVPGDKEKALAYYKLALNHNVLAALDRIFSLAKSYMFGSEGLSANQEKAQELYTLVAMHGHCEAMVCLVINYISGAWVPKEGHNAEECYKVVLKHKISEMFLNKVYKAAHEMNRNLRVNKIHVFNLLEFIARHGHVKAMWDLAAGYTEGRWVAQDLEKAFRYLSMAAEKGHAPAICELAHCYRKGIGVDVNDGIAQTLYQQAAEFEDPISYFYLAKYEAKKGNHELAFTMYKKSANFGLADAMYQVGYLHMIGRGCPIDLARARHFLEKANRRGYAQAQEALQELEELEQPELFHAHAD